MTVIDTRFMTPDGVGEVQDFMPVIEGRPTKKHRLVRQVRVARGKMTFELDLQPAFDYGRARHTLEVSDQGGVFRGADGMELTLHTSGRRDPGDPDAAKVTRHKDGLRATFTVREGQTGGVILESMGGKPRAVSPAEIARLRRAAPALRCR